MVFYSKIPLCFLSFRVRSAAFKAKPHVTCSRSWVKVGCFHDSLSPRPFPYELINDRDIYSNHSDGHLIDWKKWKESMHRTFTSTVDTPRGRDGQGVARPVVTGRRVASEHAPTPPPRGTVAPASLVLDPPPRPCNVDWSTVHVSSSTPASQGVLIGFPVVGFPMDAKCKRVLDVGIVVDSSASVHRENFFKVKEFLDKLVSELEIGPSKSHVGLVRYNQVADTLWDFNGAENNNLKSLKDAIEKIEYLPGGTRTDLALKKVNEDIFSPMGGARNDVPQVLVVITDGKTNQRSEPYSSVLQPLKVRILYPRDVTEQDKDVKIVAVGVGHSIGKKELDIIALGDASNVFMLETFDDLVRRLNAIMNSFCDTLST
ncbi:predicted protein [Nematostella vectensis]|uniref:VWFA domain-containing protein n=1 Tax=Nematostella vectensis TaxID=45351 RepID=A7SBT5_NEMVE|nr:predicted protein [Nematostella vectensis]|eukprot:XP_001630889.1 predicted protein [Nematostella vectensis]